MKPGKVVKGEITAIKPYGAFVKIDHDYIGLIHISQFSDNFVRSIEDFVSVGDVIDLKVIKISNDKLSLSYKAIHKRKKRYNIELKAGFAPLQDQLENWVISFFEKNGE